VLVLNPPPESDQQTRPARGPPLPLALLPRARSPRRPNSAPSSLVPSTRASTPPRRAIMSPSSRTCRSLSKPFTLSGDPNEPG
ncbi:hypothetical protein FIBSPDRAFT_872270, partial [Athelia psychrophila]